jgi:hypothetical protein
MFRNFRRVSSYKAVFGLTSMVAFTIIADNQTKISMPFQFFRPIAYCQAGIEFKHE